MKRSLNIQMDYSGPVSGCRTVSTETFSWVVEFDNMADSEKFMEMIESQMLPIVQAIDADSKADLIDKTLSAYETMFRQAETAGLLKSWIIV